MDVSPDKQNIDKLFSNTTYHIDFYQRDYKWSLEPGKRLLDDIFFVFDASYPKHQSLKAGAGSGDQAVFDGRSARFFF